MIDITDERLLYKAYKKSLNNRSYLASSQKVASDPLSKNNLLKIQEELKNQTFKVSGYTRFTVTKPKEREILACHFKDKIVQHVICDNVLAPKLPEICIVDNYSGQVGKGTLFARERFKQHLVKFTEENEDGFCFCGDIRKFYYNIDHDIAKEIMHKHYDKEYWWLIDEFIDSTEGVGIPLGNQINTVASTLYLNELDQYIKNELKITHYCRYADNFLILEKDKEKLKDIVSNVEKFINEKLKLEVNPKSQIVPLKNGVKFIGFHFYINHDKDIIVKLLNNKEHGHRRKFNKMIKLVDSGKISLSTLLTTQTSWEAHASYATAISFEYYHKKLGELLMKNYVSERESKKAPSARVEEGILYIPFSVNQKEDGTFSFFELRIDSNAYDLDKSLIDKVLEKIAKDMDTSTDKDTLIMKKYYPKWETLEGKSLTVGLKITYKDKVYKVRQSHTVQKDWTPGVSVTLFEVIEEQQQGTLEDPIPYDTNMTVYNGKYYVWKDIVYKCIRDSGQPLYAEPQSLLGNYFEVV